LFGYDLIAVGEVGKFPIWPAYFIVTQHAAEVDGSRRDWGLVHPKSRRKAFLPVSPRAIFDLLALPEIVATADVASVRALRC